MNEVKATGSTYDLIRRKYLVRLHELTQRNVIVYYSGWMEKAELAPRDFTGFEVSDSDKTGLMAVIHELDRSKGLDLILHTPGGNTAATESIVDYLRQMFGTDTRAIIPHLAMSAGTMIALSCSQILMGKHSSLGPIDPQVAGVAAHGIVEEFGRAATEIQNDESKVHVWAPILAKYTPTLVGECEKAIAWSFEMVRSWLLSGMFREEPDAIQRADGVIEELGSHALTKSHARHISATKARDLGLKIVNLEDQQDLQEAVLTVHHACVQTLSATPAIKIIENHHGVAVTTTMQAQQPVLQ